MMAYCVGGGPYDRRYIEVPDNKDTIVVNRSETLPDGGPAPNSGIFVYKKTGQRFARFFLFELQPETDTK